MNPRQELITLLRGKFATPILSCLAERGALERMRRGLFSVADFPDLPNKAALGAVFRYLHCLGLVYLESESGRYIATELGETVFRRSGAFLLLDSYRDYFERLSEVLTGVGAIPVVDRQKNVVGSGLLHALKFFPAALEMLRNRRWEVLVDVGCGDGTFLGHALAEHPRAIAVGVDRSDVALQLAAQRLSGKQLRTILSDGFEVSDWSRALRYTGATAVFLWFVAHEFSAGQVSRLIDFFRRLATHLPRADVFLGEIVALPAGVLSKHYDHSIMPEYLLFHALSGQGVLTWEQHRQVIAAIPYGLTAERRFDEVPGAEGESIPSSFVWHLQPRT